MFRQKSYAAVRLLMECDEKIVPLPEFKRLFAAKYGEVLDDHVIETMKHAIKVNTNDFNCINAFL